jgi:hypothetical protein
MMPIECSRGLERADIPKRLPPSAYVNATVHLGAGAVTYIYHLCVLLERFFGLLDSELTDIDHLWHLRNDTAGIHPQ